MKEIKKGKLLISTPNILGDLYFNRSIIILTEVKDEEVVGFILNKCLDYSLSDLYKNVKNNKIKVHSGGPVNQDNLYFIHNKPNVISDSIKFFKDLHWGGNFESVIE
jgi:putative transcriptional regulator